MALGSGSIANAPNTVSVGAAGTRPTDAVNMSQLSGLSQQIQRQGVVANAGIAMSMAQSEATGAKVTAGSTAVGIGTGYYAGQAAIGIGVTNTSKDAEHSADVATAMSPDVGYFGVEAGVQFKVGHSRPGARDTSADAFVPDAGRAKLGFSSVDETVPAHNYNAIFGDTCYRISLAQTMHHGHIIWHAYADQLDEIPNSLHPALPCRPFFNGYPRSISRKTKEISPCIACRKGYYTGRVVMGRSG